MLEDDGWILAKLAEATVLLLAWPFLWQVIDRAVKWAREGK
jgi:hypothetical protein